MNGGIVARRYRATLAVVSILLLFTFAPSFAWTNNLVAFPPLYWLIFVMAAAVPLLLGRGVRSVLVSPLIAWAWIYSLFLLIAYVFTPQAGSAVAFQALQTYGLGLGALLLIYLVLADPSALRIGRVTLSAAVMLAAALNFYEVFDPGVFSDVPGRAAGLYMNPTISGSALVGGMALTAGLFREWRQIAYVLTVGAATIATFSRAAIAAWLLVSLLLVLTQPVSIRKGRVVGTVVALSLGTVSLLLPVWPDAGPQIPAEVRSSVPRLGIGIAYAASDEFSAAERMEVAKEAWRLFSDHPITGSGLGATRTWSLRASTHNLYLTHLSEFGILGLLILPGLALALIKNARPPERRTLLVYASYVLFASLFSHNVLEQWAFLSTIGMAAAMSTPRVRKRRHPRDHTPRRA